MAYTTGGVAPPPALALLGGFPVPAVFVPWVHERQGRDLGVGAIPGCFLAGGALGVHGAMPMESQPLHPSLGRSTGAAPAEEAAKPGALVFAPRRQPGLRGPRPGLVLGAAVGLGFAAVESCAYAFDAALLSGAADRRVMPETEFPREPLAPLGHGPWTAIAVPRCRPGAARTGSSASPRRWWARGRAPACCTLRGTPRADSPGRPVTRVCCAEAVPGPFGRPCLPRTGAGQEHLFALLLTGGLALVGPLGAVRVRSRAPGCLEKYPLGV
ncbi:PrsW family glutamic-type intramembrane protease [Streptomyces cellostaticus]|uniref:PrsW family glutamic-type intramembrane protease n=1 Tax=Streptomyces cellostaticus TaxID=67285 RepID=UPI0020274BA2|nr:PrsW family glutamic-type intramembrane protease [Streptomyces cellostaticus]